MKYKKHLNNLFNSAFLLILISLIIGIIPFFWFKIGYIDIGGDSSRLYFYDPFHFLQYFVLNLFLPDSIGIKSGGSYMIPFVSFLAMLHFIFRSGWFVNNLINSISIVIPFLVIYAIVSETLKNIYKKSKNEEIRNVRYAAILAGLFYVFVPASSMGGWDLPLIIHTQRFVYPLLFWILFKYCNSGRSLYLGIAVLVSFIFAQNFSWVSVPNMIGFFSIIIAFLFVYWYFINRKKLSIISIVFSIFLFIAIQSFHFLPLLSNIFEKNSDVSNQLLQGENYSDVLSYINSVANFTQKGYQFIGLTPFSPFESINILLIIFPIFIALFIIKNREKKLLIPLGFFLFLYYLVTARVTNIGYYLFQKLFLLPGFVMFRNFYGRWLDIYLLFYALIVGYALFTILALLKGYQKICFSIFIVGILILNALPFIKGDISNRVLTHDTGVVVKSSSVVDSNVEDILRTFRTDPTSERNITFPIADFDYELLAGKNNDGAYFGPSLFAYLSGKNDLASSFTLRPFTDGLFKSVKENNIDVFSNIFPILGVSTVLYDDNPYIYEVFETFPYNDAKLSMPKTQNGYKDFVKNLPLVNEINFGKNFHLYEVSKSSTLPKIYIPKQIAHYSQSTNSNYDEANFNQASFVLTHFRENGADIRNVFIDNKIQISNNTTPEVSFSEVNPSKYIVSIKNVQGPYLLVLSQSFNSNWKIFEASSQTTENEEKKRTIASYFNTIFEKERENSFLNQNIFETFGKKTIADSKHITANAYANAWYITPDDLKNKTSYTIIVEMTDQRFLYLGIFISAFALLINILWIIQQLFSKK